MDNLLTNIPAKIPDEIFQTLLTSPNLALERIVSLGHSTAGGFWYDQNQNEWVLFLKGKARLRCESSIEPIEILLGSLQRVGE